MATQLAFMPLVSSHAKNASQAWGASGRGSERVMAARAIFRRPSARGLVFSLSKEEEVAKKDEVPNQPKRNLVLIGGRGCGKSSIGRRLLATDKRFKLMSLDDLIVYEANGQSIPQIVEERDWRGFRDLEYEVVKKSAAISEWALIDAGGGVVVDLDEDGNEVFSSRKVDALRATGVVVYIKRDVEYLIHRTAGDSNRPDLSASQSFCEIMERREPFYQQAADIVVIAAGKKKIEVAREVMDRYLDLTGESVERAPGKPVW
eukprot:CAMPEP_0198209992 /NCGR_PEP_ID=MMETSP1445-20131203/18139_1 /TAXON_ID=36898 /ORGANISM="Pyramimonas sp., Strain CCMP2087" /LENGTH=260 /DNA_ID=CAMNT_0043883921 /DNA_START=128 /DNA_END=907 /DNA_ORIENTATION=-